MPGDQGGVARAPTGSIARIASVWERTKVPQVTVIRREAGLMSAVVRISQTVKGAILIPG